MRFPRAQYDAWRGRPLVDTCGQRAICDDYVSLPRYRSVCVLLLARITGEFWREF